MIDKCDICNSPIKTKLELPFIDIIGMAHNYTQKVGICPNCGFIFTQNPFSSELLENRYSHFSKFEFDLQEDVSDSIDYIKRCKRQKHFIEENLMDEEYESILEIGSASGYNLSLYSNNKSVYGIEPSLANCKSAKKRYCIDLYNGVFDKFYDSEKTKKSYDLVIMSHVLEHLVNPCTFMKKCSNINNKYMFIEVPTFDYKFIDEPFGMFAEEHVNQFTLEALEHLMKKCGYKLLNAEMIFDIGNTLPAGWPAISTLWEKSSNITLHSPVSSSKFALDNYIALSKDRLKAIEDKISAINSNERIAIWGTGHHASMLLANTALSTKNIVKVLDSDVKKRGLSFAGAFIEPFNSNILDEIDTIIIATYTAQKAIERVLIPYASKVKVIKLYDL